MECRIADLRCKEVINVKDGARLGFVSDVAVDTVSGKVVAITVPGKSGLCLFGNSSNDYVIPWDAICRIGDDIVLVNFDFCPRPSKERRSWL